MFSLMCVVNMRNPHKLFLIPKRIEHYKPIRYGLENFTCCKTNYIMSLKTDKVILNHMFILMLYNLILNKIHVYRLQF